MHILFVCTGNTCRSPMAEGYFRYLVSESGRRDITVSSAGIFAGDGEPASANSLRAMKKIGVDISRHRSKALSQEMLEQADIIIAMTQSHKHYIGQMCPAALKKTKLLGEYSSAGDEIGDPFGGGSGVYSYCLNTMKPSLQKLFNDIQ